MQGLSEIRRIYGEYITEAERAGKVYSSTDGLLGIGRGAGSDPCHDRFTQRLEQALSAFAAGAPPSSDTAEVLRFIYDTPLDYKNDSMIFFMLAAAHALTENLVGLLQREDAARLLARYEDAYPKASRLPAQKKIAALLRAQAGGEAAPRSKNTFFGVFKGLFKGRGRQDV